MLLNSPLQGQEREREDRDCREGLYRKRKKRPQPKALFISPPPAAPSSSSDPGQGGCHQSCLRSPVFLVDRLLKGLFQCSPYTPPPMLSPIREGSGLYFNMLCSASAHVGPGKLPSSTLGEWCQWGSQGPWGPTESYALGHLPHSSSTLGRGFWGSAMASVIGGLIPFGP